MLKRNTFIYFSSSVGVAMIGFLSLPLSTLKLDLVHFGQFALLTAISAFCASAFNAASGYFLNSYYTTAPSSQRPSVIGSALLINYITAFVSAIISFILFFYMPGIFADFTLPTTIILFLVFSVFVLSLSRTILRIMILKEKAFIYALGSFLTVLSGTIITLILLFSTDLKLDAMIIGLIVSNFTSGSFALIWVYASHKVKIEKQYLTEIIKIIPSATAGSFLESIDPLIERSLLSKFTSASAVGLYAHAQNYPQIILKTMKAIENSAFPMSLREASSADLSFKQTQRIWSLAYLNLIFMLIFFIVFGKHFIDVWTHGKFTDAYNFAVVLLFCTSIQFLGKKAQALLYSQKRMHAITRIMIISSVLSFLVMLMSIPFFGIYGAILALFCRHILIRLCFLYLTAKSICFIEEILLLKGLIYCLPIALFCIFLDLTLIQSIILFMISSLLWIMISLKQAKQFFVFVQNNVKILKR